MLQRSDFLRVVYSAFSETEHFSFRRMLFMMHIRKMHINHIAVSIAE